MPTPETRKRLARVGPGRGLSLINRTGRNYPETGGQVPQAELDGLWWLYYNLDGDQWGANWAGDDPSSWDNVTVTSGHVTDIDLSGYSASLSGDIGGFNPASFPALRYFYVEGAGVTGDISGWRFPSTLQYLSLSNTNVTGDLSNWTVFPTISFDMTATGITGDLDQWIPGATFRTFDIINCDSGITSLPDFSSAINVRAISIYGCGLTTAVLDELIGQLYASRANYLYATQTLNYGGTTVYTQNEAPSGVYQDDATPTTGMEMLYKIEKDPDTEGINKWTITHQKYYVRGTVTGEEAEGVLVSATGDNTGNDTTDANGDYEILLETGVYTLTPTLAGYTFDPVTASVTVSGADVADNDFVSALAYLSLPFTLDFDDETTGQEPASIASKPVGSTVTVAEESLGGHTKLLSCSGGDGRVYIELPNPLQVGDGFRLQCLIRGYQSANNRFVASPMLSETAPLGTDDYIYCEFSEQESPDRIQVGARIGVSTDTNNISLGTDTTDNDPKYILFEYTSATEVAKVTVLTVTGTVYKAEQTTTLSDLAGSLADISYFNFEISTAFGMNKLAEVWIGSLTDQWPVYLQLPFTYEMSSVAPSSGGVNAQLTDWFLRSDSLADGVITTSVADSNSYTPAGVTKGFTWAWNGTRAWNAKLLTKPIDGSLTSIRFAWLLKAAQDAKDCTMGLNAVLPVNASTASLAFWPIGTYTYAQYGEATVNSEIGQAPGAATETRYHWARAEWDFVTEKITVSFVLAETGATEWSVGPTDMAASGKALNHIPVGMKYAFFGSQAGGSTPTVVKFWIGRGTDAWPT